MCINRECLTGTQVVAERNGQIAPVQHAIVDRVHRSRRRADELQRRRVIVVLQRQHGDDRGAGVLDLDREVDLLAHVERRRAGQRLVDFQLAVRHGVTEIGLEVALPLGQADERRGVVVGRQHVTAGHGAVHHLDEVIARGDRLEQVAAAAGGCPCADHLIDVGIPDAVAVAVAVELQLDAVDARFVRILDAVVVQVVPHEVADLIVARDRVGDERIRAGLGG